MMIYKFVIPTLYFISTLSLFPEVSNLSDVHQESGEKKAILTPVKEKKSRFIFKDTSTHNGTGSNNEDFQKNESKKYVYENKSRFKFQFAAGTGNSNMLKGQGKSSSYSGKSGAVQSKKSRQ